MNGLGVFRNHAVRWFAVGLIACGLAGTVAFMAPAKVFPHASWFDHGMRLLHDDVEVDYYFAHAAWVRPSLHLYTPDQDYPPMGVWYFSLPRLLTGW